MDITAITLIIFCGALGLFLFLMLCLSVVQRNKSIELQTTNEYQTKLSNKKRLASVGAAPAIKIF